MIWALAYFALGTLVTAARYALVGVLMHFYPAIRGTGGAIADASRSTPGLFIACVLMWPFDLVIDSIRLVVNLTKLASAIRTARKLERALK